MSIKPLDMQIIVPKMTEVAKMHGSDTERQQVAAQQNAASAQKTVEANVRVVHQKKSVQKVVVHEKRDDEREGGNKRGKKRQDTGKNGSDEKTRGHEQHSEQIDRHIDIKL